MHRGLGKRPRVDSYWCLEVTVACQLKQATCCAVGCRTVDTTPDALHMHKALAGIADRGASVAVLECHTGAMMDGRLVAWNSPFHILLRCNRVWLA